MATHTMKLQPLPFAHIQAGTKTIELRLNDEKRRGVKVGDFIDFYKEPDLVESLTVKVTERLTCATFAELVRAHPPMSMGLERIDDT